MIPQIDFKILLCCSFSWIALLGSIRKHGNSLTIEATPMSLPLKRGNKRT